MPSLREERLQERVAEVRPGLQKAREVAELAESEHREMTDAEQKIYDEGVAKARDVADAMKQYRHDQEVFAFMTTEPNALTQSINHERMPVLLTCEDEFETWLRGSPDEAFALGREYPAHHMRLVQEGFDKEDLLRAA